MAEILIKTVFQLKRGLAEAWTRVNPLLRPGEPGFELDTGKLKIGNGIDNWTELPYFVGDDEGALHFKGSVNTKADLPTENNEIGDIWQVIDESKMYVWNASNDWEIFHAIDLSNYVQKDELVDFKLENGIADLQTVLDGHELRVSTTGSEGWTENLKDNFTLTLYSHDISARAHRVAVNADLNTAERTTANNLDSDFSIELKSENFINNVCKVTYEFYKTTEPEPNNFVLGGYLNIVLCTIDECYNVEPSYMKNYLKKDSIKLIDCGDADDWV